MRFQDGLYFLQLMKYGILQYAVIRPVYVFQPPSDPSTDQNAERRLLPLSLIISVFTAHHPGHRAGDIYMHVI